VTTNAMIHRLRGNAGCRGAEIFGAAAIYVRDSLDWSLAMLDRLLIKPDRRFDIHARA
jgi:hypothetical protein